MSLSIIDRFKNGEIIIFPTDTVYGIGCVISNEKSIERLYKIKEREASKPTLILVSSLEQAKRYGYFDKQAEKITGKFWPGPLTIAIKATPQTPHQILGPNKTIALRVPDQPPLLEMLDKLGVAVLAPSANFAGETAPHEFSQIDSTLVSLVDYAIDLAQFDGKALTGLPSTIVDLTENKPKIIREGSILKEELEKAFDK